MTFARCPWYIAGPLLGLIMIGLRAALNRPFGAIGGYVELVSNVARPERWGVPAFITIGTFVGGFLFAVASGTFAPALHYGAGGGLLPADSPGQFAILAAAGVAMGFGARTAGGCTSGHGLCGTSLGSPASFIATMTFFATAVALAHVWVWIFGGVA